MSDFKDNQVEYDTDHHMANMEAWERAEGVFEARSTEEKLEAFLWEGSTSESAERCADLVQALMKTTVMKTGAGMELTLELCEGLEAWEGHKAEWCRDWLDR